MGKGNRNKNKKATEVLLSSKQKTEKKAKGGLPTWVGTLIVVAVLVALVAVIAFSTMYAKGTFLHFKTVAKSEHYSFNASMMSYVLYSEYQNFVSQYSSSSYGNILSYIKGTGGDSLDTSTGLRSQYYSKPTESSPDTATQTWFDYFATSAQSSATQVLTYCEIANYYSITLDDEDRAEIEESLDEIADYARSQGYTTNEYLMAMYGKGVTLREVRKVMELSQLASKVATLKEEEFERAVVDSRIDAEYEANKSDYDIYVSYLAYTFTATFNPEASEEDGEESGDVNKDALLDAYIAKQALYADRVEQLKAAATEEDFTNLITVWVYQDTSDEVYAEKYDEFYEALYEDALNGDYDEAYHRDYTDAYVAEFAKDSDVDAAKRAGALAVVAAACRKAADEEAQAASLKASIGATVLNHTASDETNDLDTWLYEDGRAFGDKTTIVSAADAKDTDGNFIDDAVSTYSAYFMIDPIHNDNGEVVRSVGHILFKTETYDGLTSTESLSGKVKELADKVLARDGSITAYTMAVELLDTMKSEGKITTVTEGDKTYYVVDKDAFEDYGLDYTEDSNVFYEHVGTGEMVQEFEDWLFDGARFVGEISYPEPVLSEDYGYHIMMYVGDEQKAWRHEIAESLASADFEAWYTAEAEKVTVDYNARAMDSLSG